MCLVVEMDGSYYLVGRYDDYVWFWRCMMTCVVLRLDNGVVVDMDEDLWLRWVLMNISF